MHWPRGAKARRLVKLRLGIAGKRTLKWSARLLCVMNLPLLLALAGGFLLAGCAGDSGGSTSLDYNGANDGTHNATTHCNSDGTLSGSGKIDNGSVRITVRDGSGTQLFSQSYSSSFDAAANAMHGASGTWTVEGTRSGAGLVGAPFSGHYSFHLAC